MKALLVLAGLLCFALAQNTITLSAIVRDFTPDGANGGFPDGAPNYDFENWCCGVLKGLVSPTLDGDSKPTLANPNGVTSIHNEESFSWWYRDTPGVNIHFDTTITLTETSPGSGVYQYSNNNYFPIDNQGWGNYQNWGHNFHFTTEIHTQFSYEQGQVFEFNGDDDVWVFIDGTLAIDIGGVHGQTFGSVNLDDLGFVVGSTHTLDVFQAERHTSGSTFEMTTSIVLIPVQPPSPGRQACLCAVCIENFCNQPDQSTCPSDPTVTFPFGAGTYSFDNFNFISFGDIVGDTSDTQGRVIAKNDITFSAGYSVGYELRTGGATAIDNHLPYAAVAGGSFTWPTGAIYPQGNGIPYAGLAEGIFCGDNDFSSTDPALNAADTGYCPAPGCLDNDFINAQAYYTMFSQQLGAVADSATSALLYEGLTFTCSDPSAASYSVTIDDSVLAGTTYYNAPVGCNAAATWVINVAGSGSANFAGNQIFPGVAAEDIVWNILGSGRTVNCHTEVHGTLLAPQQTYFQDGGVWVGNVIVATVTGSHQINRLKCPPPPPPASPPNDQSFCVFFETACAGMTMPLGNSIYSFRDFNVVSFADFNANTGDVEGRVGCAGDFTVGAGFSVGYQLQTQGGGDNDLPYALVVNGDCTFPSGDVYPNGFNSPYPGHEENIYCGGTFTGADYLQARVTNTPCSHCLDSYFAAAQSCYAGYQNAFDAQTDTVTVEVQWSAIILTCSDVNAARYYVHLTTTQLNDATYYTTSNCNFQAEWVITISGTDDVNFHGDQFPAPNGAVLYNIVGNGRTVTAGTGVLGHILAPYNNLNQISGVIIGKVVAANVDFATQINKPDCYNPGDVTVTVPTTSPSSTNSVTTLPGSSLNVGDDVTIQGTQVTITNIDSNSDGDTITFDQDIPSADSGTKMTSSVDGTRGGVSTNNTSGAASLSAFFALIFALFFF